MKIFSILLLQCKKVSCRMENCLVPEKCQLVVEVTQPSEKDVEFLDAQAQTICSINTETNKFVLLEIIDALEKSSTVDSQTFLFEMAPTEPELSRILDSSSVSESLSQDRLSYLFSFLINSKIDNGALVCTKCREVYPIVNGIIDFVNQQEDV